MPSTWLWRGIVAAVVASATARIAASAGIAATAPAWVATARVTTAGIATAATATVLRIVLVRLFAFEIDGVDDGVGALGGFDGFDEVLFAVAVDSVGEDDEGFATGLFAHELV